MQFENIKKTWWHSKIYWFVISSSFVMHIQLETIWHHHSAINVSRSWIMTNTIQRRIVWSQYKQEENKLWQNVSRIRVDLKCIVNLISIRDFCEWFIHHQRCYCLLNKYTEIIPMMTQITRRGKKLKMISHQFSPL